MFVVDDFNALIQPGIIVQKQVLVILCFGKKTIVIFLVRLAVLADKSDYLDPAPSKNCGKSGTIDECPVLVVGPYHAPLLPPDASL